MIVDEEVNPHIFCHSEGGDRLPREPLTVSNFESKETWNCGETCPVLRFRTNATLLAC